MRDWEMAEHFAERDGVRMASGQHIQAPESMIDRARRTLANPTDEADLAAEEWAEALLAEHDAWRDAVRKTGDERAEAWRALARAEEAERERDTLRRELEFVKTGAVAWCDRAEAAEERAADLEAALWEYGRHKGGCAYRRRHTRPGRPKRDGRCDCGLDAVLAGGSDES